MSWNRIRVDEVLSRDEVHARCSDSQGQGRGQRYGGIATPKATPDILLFDTSAGDEHGYIYDGPHEDGTYHYTGEGQDGDQKFIKGNLKVRDHRQLDLRLQLFKGVSSGKLRYLGEYRLDERQPHYEGESTDKHGDLRKVIVFRLRGARSPVELDEPMPAGQLRVDDIDLTDEAESVLVHQLGGSREAKLREASLVKRYVEWLKKQGCEVTRKRISLPTPGSALTTDLYDETRSELIEAKSSAARPYVRLALGQILDYSRFVNSARQRAVLFPTRPVADLVRLLHSHGVVCIYEDGTPAGQFHREEPPPANEQTSP
ncbi:hypothetical protein [Actinomadura sp. HBU206391]|uniref:hypothetical protein n=1 Tax=Actinomadura sp. HBU206391 TaxID=2731692 RepID=UPI00164FACDA|nr:hypothetical protein [Actinomadura sp. HBU206391]MBC6457061.1 hypothetical protein [Actinomadura sp. HBU206391]